MYRYDDYRVKPIKYGEVDIRHNILDFEVGIFNSFKTTENLQ